MSKALKNHIQKDLEHRFQDLDGYILVDFRGLNSAQSFDLRRTLHGAGVRMNVVPNRLALRVLDRWEGRRPEFREFFRGPTAVLFGENGPLAASRVVAQWRKKNKDLLAIKGGVLEGEIVPAAQVESLARIPDRPQLLANLAGTLKAPLTRLAIVVQGPLRQLAQVLEAYRKKREESGERAAAPEPPPEAASAETRGDTAPEAAAEGPSSGAGSAEGGPVGARPAEAGSAEAGLAEAGPAEAGPAEAGPAEAGPGAG